jgi:hypothetical protein
MYDFLEQAVPKEALNTVIFTLSALVSGQTAGLALEHRKHHQGDHTPPK